MSTFCNVGRHLSPPRMWIVLPIFEEAVAVEAFVVASVFGNQSARVHLVQTELTVRVR